MSIWYLNKYLVARNCLHSSKKSNGNSFTFEITVLFTTIKMLYLLCSLFSFPIAMFFKRQNMMCLYFTFIRRPDLSGRYLASRTMFYSRFWVLQLKMKNNFKVPRESVSQLNAPAYCTRKMDCHMILILSEFL